MYSITALPANFVNCFGSVPPNLDPIPPDRITAIFFIFPPYNFINAINIRIIKYDTTWYLKCCVIHKQIKLMNNLLR